MKNIVLLFALFVINGCSGIEEKKESTDATAAKLEEIDTIEIVDEVAPKTPDLIISDNISILLPTSYSSEEFSKLQSNLESTTWVGLFSNDNNSVRCSKTKLQVEPVHDQMFDEDGEMSGRMISCEGCDNNPMLLIEGIEISADVQIDSYKGLRSRLLPGESMQLGDITIKALGTWNDNGSIEDYKLVITGKKNGNNIEQTFLEQKWFDEAMIDFIWAGDIDKDGFPDLYMDISYKYSFSNPALFLSSKAGDTELLKLVAAIRVF
jgi:hypothetical protein